MTEKECIVDVKRKVHLSVGVDGVGYLGEPGVPADHRLLAPPPHAGAVLGTPRPPPAQQQEPQYQA